ncbi:MAG TPA: phosphoribosyltransferase family protein [Spirochaetota bacterium]|nr:phosphoribosyltransferase family protein [Spirochaetota bacterium]
MNYPDLQVVSSYDPVITVPVSGIRDHSDTEEDLSAELEFIKDDPRTRSMLITRTCIQKRIDAMARHIAGDYRDAGRIDMLVVLTGAFMFAADLCRDIYHHRRIDTPVHMIKTSVYDQTIKDTREKYRAVQLELAPKQIEGRHILLIEDIADQGFTLTWLKDYLLNERNVASIKICSLIYKELDHPTDEVRKLRDNLDMDYIGFIVPDVWVAGYGVDAAHEFRNMPYIVWANENYYLSKKG